MILLIGSDEDPSLDYFSDYLRTKKQKFLFLNQKKLLQGIDLFSGYLIYEGTKYHYSDFSGVLNRCSFPDIKDIEDDSTKKYFQCNSLLNCIINCEFDNVLNRSFLGVSNDSKMFQLNIVNSKIIKIPSFLVIANLNIKDTISTHSKCGYHVVKSLSSIRSIATKFETNENIFSGEKSTEPVIFQELIDGVNIRVHVVENECFATKISSDTIDYRYNNTIQKFEIYDLPQNIKDECVAISKQLQLRFTGIDLLKKDKEYYLLEANPCPGWTYFEKEVDNRCISNKLIETLNC